MNRFVFIGTGKDYVKRVWRSLLSREDVAWFDEPFVIRNKLLKTACHAHSSFLLNRYFNLPFRALWEKCASIEKAVMNSSDVYYFILFDNALARYTPSQMKRFKKKHSNAVIVLFLDNAMHKKERLIAQHLANVDLIYTNNQYDADRYGFKYIFNIFPPIGEEEARQPVEWDVFFVGNAYDRLDTIHSVYDRLTDLGLDTRMYVSGVSKPSDRNRKGIAYNQHLSYDIVTDCYNRSRCLLEVVGEKPTMLTMRMMEAVSRNKKLLTNHPLILDQPFYDPRYIQYFEKPEEINLEFFRNNTDVSYKIKNDYSPDGFLTRIVTDSMKKKEE